MLKFLPGCTSIDQSIQQDPSLKNINIKSFSAKEEAQSLSKNLSFTGQVKFKPVPSSLKITPKINAGKFHATDLTTIYIKEALDLAGYVVDDLVKNENPGIFRKAIQELNEDRAAKQEAKKTKDQS